jgi:Phosphotransferase enzyme family
VIGHHDVAPWNAVWRDGALVGFIDWAPAGPSSRALDLAFAALSWVPLLPAGMASVQGFTAFEDRSRWMHLLLDSYGYHADRAEFGALVARRTRMNAAGIRRLAGNDPVYASLLPMAAAYEQAATDVDELPHRFWSPTSDDPQGTRAAPRRRSSRIRRRRPGQTGR